MEKNEQEEPLIQKEQYKAKKKIIIIILTILGVALTIGAFVYIAIIVQEKYDNEEDKEKENITEKFEYGLTLEELENRTSPGHLGKLIYLKKDSKEYKDLEDGDKTALKYLTKAAVIMDEVFLRLDNVHNIPFKKFLESEINNSTNTTNTTRIKQANLTKILFDSFKGINGYDTLGEEVNLAKNITSTEVLGLYPEDLTEKKFHEILIQMLKENKTEEVRNITSQRTIVLWDENKKYLKSIDYVDYFKDNFTEVAELFLNASKCSTNAKFNNFLELQAEALKKIDPNKDFEAEKIYAELQDTPLELTLMKEDYDIFTETALENEELKQLLDKNNIKTYSKDVLGLRVGIVNKEGTNALLRLKASIPKLAQSMPFYDQYKNNSNDEETYKNYTMVDADLIMLTGVLGLYRGLVRTAELLPNSDKLSVITTGKKRFVFHRQLKNLLYNEEEQKKKPKELIHPSQADYYDNDAAYWFYLGQEISTNFGPKIANSTLDKYKGIFEFIKAYLASFYFIDILKEEKVYTDEILIKKIKISSVANLFLKEKPDIEYHEKSNKLILCNLLRGKMYNITDGKIYIFEDKISSVAKEELENVIGILLENEENKAKEFYDNYSDWTPELINISQILKKYDNELHYEIENELGDYLLNLD